MTILLARQHKWHPPLQKRLKDLRARIDKLKLVDHRNLLVHGVHKTSPKPQHFILYSPRRSGDAQETEISVQRAYEIGQQIYAEALEVWSIFEAYGAWKYPGHDAPDIGGQFVAVPTGRFARIKQYLRSRLDHRGRWG